MSSQFKECLKISKKLERKVERTGEAIDRLKRKVNNVSFFSFDGFSLPSEIDDLEEETAKLKTRAKNSRKSVNNIAGIARFSEDEVLEISLIWEEMKDLSEDFERDLTRARAELEGRNLWSGIFSTFDQVYRNIEGVVKNLGKVVFWPVRILLPGEKKLPRLLPPSEF